ncbi:MAG: 4'-phosphopantetheinyl transferase superfamily protein, partial [Anaerolineales bacterium]|nr:4'-phosphopantetheinyl transferase superfamily protein [Anaerolineales bacterium]
MSEQETLGMAQSRKLRPGEVHLWWSSLSATESVSEVLVSAVLSSDEQVRAARFHFARDRRRFILTRGMLRHGLAMYVDQRPQDIRFEYGAHGKPRLDSDVTFNLAHSHDMVVCAIARGRAIGVDVERTEPMRDWAHIATKTFSRAEQDELFALELSEQLAGFFNGWTRKEAYVKARGDGLAIPLDSFDVSLKPGEPARLLGNRLDASEVGRWSLAAIGLPQDYVGAIAAQGQIAEIV